MGFFHLLRLFSISSMANIAGNAYSNYLSFSAVFRFLIKQLGVDQKSVRIPFNTWLAPEFSR